MDIDVKIQGFEAEIKPVSREDNIKAFVTWVFQTDRGVIKIHGGTIRSKAFGMEEQERLTFDGPAVRSRGGFTKVFFWDEKEIYKQLCEHTTEKYYQTTGEVREERRRARNSEPDLDDLPF